MLSEEAKILFNKFRASSDPKMTTNGVFIHWDNLENLITEIVEMENTAQRGERNVPRDFLGGTEIPTTTQTPPIEGVVTDEEIERIRLNVIAEGGVYPWKLPTYADYQKHLVTKQKDGK